MKLGTPTKIGDQWYYNAARVRVALKEKGKVFVLKVWDRHSDDVVELFESKESALRVFSAAVAMAEENYARKCSVTGLPGEVPVDAYMEDCFYAELYEQEVKP